MYVQIYEQYKPAKNKNKLSIKELFCTANMRVFNFSFLILHKPFKFKLT